MFNQLSLTGMAGVLLAVLAACVGPEPTHAPDSIGDDAGSAVATANLDGTEWVLASLDGGNLIDRTNITLSFGDGMFGGFAGCNGYGGKYTVAGAGALTLAEMASTAQACQTPEGVMDQEASYLATLLKAATYRVVDDRLEIVDMTGETALVFAMKEEFPMDPSTLEGTAWQLLSLNGHSPLEGSAITITFAEGKIQGHAGCRGYRGAYEASGDDIRFPFLEMTETDCPKPEAWLIQEGEYTDGLSLATNYRLGEGQLEIFTAPGGVLIFDPEPPGADVGQQVTPLAVETDPHVRSPEEVEEPVPGCVEIDYALPSTEEAIGLASIIVIGTVEALAPPGSGSDGLPTYDATILVEQTLRGEHEPGRPFVVTIPGNCPDQGFIQAGERVLLLVENRVIGAKERLILYPYGKYLLTEDGQALNALDGGLNTTLEQLLTQVSAAQTLPDDVELAQNVLITFFERLHNGQYHEAAELYGGSYEVLVEYNPNLDPEDHPTLLQNACTIDGFQCLRVLSAILQEQTSSATFSFDVEFENVDGTLFEFGPCCGADETAMPTQSQFAFTVLKDNKGRFLVQELPIYVP